MRRVNQRTARKAALGLELSDFTRSRAMKHRPVGAAVNSGELAAVLSYGKIRSATPSCR